MQIETILPANVPGSPIVAVAEQLELAFLEEMLKYCGPPPSDGAFGGGAGEDQFSSFLTREHAALLADKLDLGFARILGNEP